MRDGNYTEDEYDQLVAARDAAEAFGNKEDLDELNKSLGISTKQSYKGYGYGLAAGLFIAVSVALAVATFGFSLIPQTAVMIGVTVATGVIGLGLGAKAYSDSRSDAFTPSEKFEVVNKDDAAAKPDVNNSGLGPDSGLKGDHTPDDDEEPTAGDDHSLTK